MANPLDVFKTARRDAVAEATAEQRAAAAAALAAFTASLREHVGDDLLEQLTVKPLRAAGEFQIDAKDHLPVIGRVCDGVLRFKVRRRDAVQTFDHFGDALAFGEPFPLRKKCPPADLPGGVIDTTPTESEPTDGAA